MLTIRIDTSKRGRLWPTEYWKPLIDAVARGGAKQDPRSKYADLRSSIDFVEERDGRFYPRAGIALCDLDDVTVGMVVVKRVPNGSEQLWIGEEMPPDTAEWLPVDFPYFGTIGDSKYEAQTYENPEKLSGLLTPCRDRMWLGLAFRLSSGQRRRRRDADNLADGLMPLFNRCIPRLDEICLIRLDAEPVGFETLRFHLRPLG